MMSSTVKTLIIILMSGVLTNNYVLVKFLGICPFLGVSKKKDQAFGMGLAVIFVMLCATAVTWPIQVFVLDRFGLGYMQTIVFILIIAALVQFIETAMKKFLPALHASLGVYLPLITTNCAVLGVCLNNFTDGYGSAELGFLKAMISSLGVGVGFLFSMVLFAGVRSRMEHTDVPKAFDGLPITLTAAAILSLSFFGFGGVIQGMLG